MALSENLIPNKCWGKSSCVPIKWLGLRHYLIRRSSYGGGCLSKSSSCGLPIKSTGTGDTSLQVLKSLEKNNNTMNCHELEQIVFWLIVRDEDQRPWATIQPRARISVVGCNSFEKYPINMNRLKSQDCHKSYCFKYEDYEDDCLVVWNIFYFSHHIGNNHPNWRTPWFFRGVAQPPSRWESKSNIARCFPHVNAGDTALVSGVFSWCVPAWIHDRCWWWNMANKCTGNLGFDVEHGIYKVLPLVKNMVNVQPSNCRHDRI